MTTDAESIHLADWAIEALIKPLVVQRFGVQAKKRPRESCICLPERSESCQMGNPKLIW